MKLKNRGLADVSTAHITKNDSDLLESAAEGHPELTVYSDEYGFLVGTWVVEQDPQILIDLGFSLQFVKILEHASKQKMAYVNFDCDGERYEELKEHKW